MAARSADVEELSVGQKCTKYLDFKASPAKFEASTYTTTFTKDNCRTIAVTNKRLGIQRRFMSLPIRQCRLNKNKNYRSISGYRVNSPPYFLSGSGCRVNKTR